MATNCWGVLWFFKRQQVSLLEKQRNRQHDIWCLITNTWPNRVAAVSSVITRNLTLAKGQSTFNLQICLCSVHRSIILLPVYLLLFISIVCLSFTRFCSLLFDLLLFDYSVFDYLILQCYFLFLYWHCIPDILIHKTTYQQPSGKSINIIHKSFVL